MLNEKTIKNIKIINQYVISDVEITLVPAET